MDDELRWQSSIFGMFVLGRLPWQFVISHVKLTLQFHA